MPESELPSKSHASPLSGVHVTMLVFGALIVVFIWALFIYQSIHARHEALDARRSEHRNLALIVSESLKQMTDRAKSLGDEIAVQSSHHGYERVLNLLAEDPVFNRLSVYDSEGTPIFSSHPSSGHPGLSDWIEQLGQHIQTFGYEPILPLRRTGSGDQSRAPVWRLPVLVPVPDKVGGSLQKVIIVELDIGYLAGLLQHIELGTRGFLQVLDSRGAEWMRADSGGVIVGGEELPPIKPASEGRVASGHREFELDDTRFQYVHVTRAPHAFSVAIAQPEPEILASLMANQRLQFGLNVLMTALVVGIIIWLRSALLRQQSALHDLQVSERKNQRLIDRLESEHARSSRAAAIDHLSGLFNRRQFIETASEALSEQRRKRRMTALMFIDLDRFKAINDSLGHKVGDLLLQAVAGRIRNFLGPEDLAARFGGDEFVVLLGGDRREADIEGAAKGLHHRLSQTYELDGIELNNSPSIGIAICPRDGQTIDDLIQSADAAMYSAKKAGRGQYRFFDQSLNVTDAEAFHLEQAFPEALANRQFVLHFQPQVCLDTMRISGFESLVRWQHPEFGLLYPDRFIDMAETTGLIIPMGLEVLRLTCEHLLLWRDDGLEIDTVAVNVSPVQLTQPDFGATVLELLKSYGLKPKDLELEITETAVLDARAAEQIHILKNAGIVVSLDDFGTGYSGFAHLESVPVDKLKIDRSLISRISNSHDDSPIVSSTIILAKRMNLKVVAEGVETREQLVHLKVAGCDFAQGYHISRPIPADQVAGFIGKAVEALEEPV